MTYLDKQFDKYLVEQKYKFDFGYGCSAVVHKKAPKDLFDVKASVSFLCETNATNLAVSMILASLEWHANQRRLRANGK